ncbi:unnamed protein product [Aphanomyces euteiches]|uniref:Uncharacterized protein n=1 Tax=Aphanomyces euteiches TaxID=100861 RepID=A0A6G0WF13_9STRA|nr:hypothetical protein Ae201684_015731 [Aphanomyces euteiches]KAH9093696.1 hypothetical protein Ae201684P_016320 [Aphanomyces euteiches]KAH9138800.1 hypothetical protein AeRB84_016896 [Aphanomyces euteiches]
MGWKDTSPSRHGGGLHQYKYVACVLIMISGAFILLEFEAMTALRDPQYEPVTAFRGPQDEPEKQVHLRSIFRPPHLDAEHFKPRKIHYVTLADNPREEICLTGASIYTLSKGQLQILAWNHSTTFFDGTSPSSANSPRVGDFRAGQAKKIEWIAHYILHHPDLHEDDVVMYTDAWDVAIQTDMSGVGNTLLKFTSGRRGIIFNSEPSCGDSFELLGGYGDYLRSRAAFDVQLQPDAPIFKVPGPHICRQMLIKSAMHSSMGGPNWSLGSGGIVADVKSLRTFMQRVVQVTDEQIERHLADPNNVPLFEGDQISFQLAYLRFPEINVMVDTKSEIFMVTSYMTTPGVVERMDNANGCAPDFYKDGAPSKHSWYGHTPMILHFPGDYKKFWTSCGDPMAEILKSKVSGKVMWDVDRNVPIPIRDVCPVYT